MKHWYRFSDGDRERFAFGLERDAQRYLVTVNRHRPAHRHDMTRLDRDAEPDDGAQVLDFGTDTVLPTPYRRRSPPGQRYGADRLALGPAPTGCGHHPSRG